MDPKIFCFQHIVETTRFGWELFRNPRHSMGLPCLPFMILYVIWGGSINRAAQWAAYLPGRSRVVFQPCAETSVAPVAVPVRRSWHPVGILDVRRTCRVKSLSSGSRDCLFPLKPTRALWVTLCEMSLNKTSPNKIELLHIVTVSAIGSNL